MAEEKIYINGIFVKKVQFQNGGCVINASINVDAFIKELQETKNEKGYCNIVIADRQQPDKNGNNMYVKVNKYKPKDKETQHQVDDVLPF